MDKKTEEIFERIGFKDIKPKNEHFSTWISGITLDLHKSAIDEGIIKHYEATVIKLPINEDLLIDFLEKTDVYYCIQVPTKTFWGQDVHIIEFQQKITLFEHKRSKGIPYKDVSNIKQTYSNFIVKSELWLNWEVEFDGKEINTYSMWLPGVKTYFIKSVKYLDERKVVDLGSGRVYNIPFEITYTFAEETQFSPKIQIMKCLLEVVDDFKIEFPLRNKNLFYLWTTPFHLKEYQCFELYKAILDNDPQSYFRDRVYGRVLKKFPILLQKHKEVNFELIRDLYYLSKLDKML